MDSRHPLRSTRRAQLRSFPRRSAPHYPHGWQRIRQWVGLPVGDLPILLEAIAWIAGATLLRMIADWLLAMQPALWIPVAFVLVLPAVLTISLSMWAPPLSLVLGYRLLLTAMGLILGGRL